MPYTDTGRVLPSPKRPTSRARAERPAGSSRVLVLAARKPADNTSQLEEDGSEPRQKDESSPTTRVHVRVDSKVRDVEHGNARSTGQFNYTFSVPKDLKVVPHNYTEHMMYIDARRRVKLGDIQSRQDRIDSAEERDQLVDSANLTE